MKTWNYVMPLVCWLLYGDQYKGTVQAVTKSEAHAAVKKKFAQHKYPLSRFPVGGTLELVQ